jgi:hypothetical protein
MEGLSLYKKALQNVFTSLTTFSDLDWNEVTAEYLCSHDERPEMTEFTFNFPDYLQGKSQSGDSPAYLFELAFYDLALHQLSLSEHPETLSGIFLNPTALFLNFEFDIPRMLEDAVLGTINVHLRNIILTLYRNAQGEIIQSEMTEHELTILSLLEAGPQKDESFLAPSQKAAFSKLLSAGLIQRT